MLWRKQWMCCNQALFEVSQSRDRGGLALLPLNHYWCTIQKAPVTRQTVNGVNSWSSRKKGMGRPNWSFTHGIFCSGAGLTPTHSFAPSSNSSRTRRYGNSQTTKPSTQGNGCPCFTLHSPSSRFLNMWWMDMQPPDGTTHPHTQSLEHHEMETFYQGKTTITPPIEQLTYAAQTGVEKKVPCQSSRRRRKQSNPKSASLHFPPIQLIRKRHLRRSNGISLPPPILWSIRFFCLTSPLVRP